MASARRSFGAVLDSAERGRAVVIRRHARTAAVVQADQLRDYRASTLDSRLSTLDANAEVFKKGGHWVVLLRNRPFVAESLTVDEAIDDLVASLREHAEEWEDLLSSV